VPGSTEASTRSEASVSPFLACAISSRPSRSPTLTAGILPNPPSGSAMVPICTRLSGAWLT